MIFCKKTQYVKNVLSIPLGLHILIDCLLHGLTVLGDRDVAKNKGCPFGALLLAVKINRNSETVKVGVSNSFSPGATSALYLPSKGRM